MGGLLQKRLNPERSIEAGLPMYSIHGRLTRRRRKVRIPNGLLVFTIVFIILGIFIYLPPLFIKEIDPWKLPSYTVQANETALAEAQAYLKNNPDEDFDGDGLTNEKEQEYGISPYNIDTDDDGVTDYAELYISETNPGIYDNTIINYMKRLDAENGKQVNSPLKIHDVVLWPENYESRTKGAVVRTMEGYRFCNFTGWAQFPSGQHAYKIVNGRHVPLQTNSNGYFYIEDEVTTVRVYDEDLEIKHKVSVVGRDIILDEGPVGSILTFLLPSRGMGILTSRQVAAVDTKPVAPVTLAYADITVPESFPLPASRFGRSFNKLSDLASITDAIDEGQCVILSLYSYEHGEAFVLVYGYNSIGNLFVADINTGEPLGAINYEERAGRYLDHTGEIQQYEWYLFQGCGFNSAKGHRIAIIGFVDSLNKQIEAPSTEAFNDTGVQAADGALYELDIVPDLDEESGVMEILGQELEVQENEEDDVMDTSSASNTSSGIEQGDEGEGDAYYSKSGPGTFVYSPEISLDEDLQAFTYDRCQELGLEYELVLAIMWRESRFKTGAVGINTNGTKDSGLMQINDVNRDWLRKKYGITDLMDPKQNIIAGTAILSEHMDRFGDEQIAVLAYGAGSAGAQRRLEQGTTMNSGVELVLQQRDNFRATLYA